MAKSISEQVRALKERDAARERDVALLWDELSKEQQARITSQVEVAALKQQLQDHVKHTELSDSRRWTLIVALLGAALSLASGLIVSLSRK